MNVIETENLCKRYGNQMRVNGIDLRVREGCVYGFLGPNGAGKTTTLKLILGLVKATDGTVKLFGKQMNEKNRLELLRKTGSLIENPSYYGHLTGEENLKISAKLKGVPDKEIYGVLDMVRLSGQKDKKVKHYSLGMKQRLGIAQALLGSPNLLILDEPTNGLDPAGIQEMRELVMALPKQKNMTVIVSSHILSEIDQMADMAGIINDGELVFQDTMKKLHSMSRQYLCMRISDVELGRKKLTDMKIHFEDLDDGYIGIPVIEDRFVAVLLKSFFDEGIMVYRLEERRKSLEDIFLEMTGGIKSL